MSLGACILNHILTENGEKRETLTLYFVSTLTIKGHLIYLTSMEKNKSSTKRLPRTI